MGKPLFFIANYTKILTDFLARSDIDQMEFCFTRELFDLYFPFCCTTSVGMLFIVKEFYGASCLGVFCTFVGAVVFLNTLCHVGSYPSIEGGIAAFYYINKVWHVISNVT